MSAQGFEDFLAFLINAITVSFLLITAVDFVTGLVKLMERQKKTTIVSPKQLNPTFRTLWCHISCDGSKVGMKPV